MQSMACAHSGVMHQYTARDATVMKFIGNGAAIARLHMQVQPLPQSAFLFEVIGWAYFQAIIDPVQQLVSKMGGGVIFKGGYY